MHSRYFKRLCEGAFSESGERRVVLKGDSLAAVRAMIDYFYTFDYAEPIINPVDRAAEDEDPEPRAVLEAHAHVYALGDKYDIEGTSDLAVQKFRDCAGELSRNDDDPAVQSRFTEPADGFVTATEFVYKNSSAGDRMRRLLLDWWCDGENLLEHIDIHAWETLLADVPGFSSEFIAELTGITIGERRAT